MRRRLHGREPELAAITAALADAVEPSAGSLFLLAGEAGIGKTRLCDEVAAHAVAAGVDVAWGRCWEAGGAPAFWPWREALDALGAPATWATSSSSDGAFAIFDAVCAFFAARPRRVLVILDDLHAADAASLELLLAVARRLRRLPVVVVGTLRPEEARADPAIAELVARLSREARTLALPPLSPAAGHALVQEAAGRDVDAAVAGSLVDAAHGNPLFLDEIVRLLASEGRLVGALGRGVPGDLPVPTSARDAIRRRLKRLDDDVNDALAHAAVVGVEGSVGIVAALLGRDVVAVEALLERARVAGALRDGTPSGRFRFHHALVREAVYRDVPTARRQALHARAAAVHEALSASLDVDAEASAVALEAAAHHLLQAGVGHLLQAIELARRAASRARARLAADDAVVLLERASAAADPAVVDAATRAALLVDLGRARIVAHRVEAGREACRAAAQAATRAGDAALLAEAALAYGAVFQFGRVDPELTGLLERALSGLPSIAGSPNHQGLIARVEARLAAARQPAHDPGAPMQLARDAIARARTVAGEDGGDDVLLEVLYNAVSAMMDFGPPAERIALNLEVLALAERRGDTSRRLRSCLRLVFDHIDGGDTAAAFQMIAVHKRHAEANGRPHAVWPQRALEALQAAFEGRFVEALALNTEARRLGAEANDPQAALSTLVQRSAIALTGDDRAELETSAAAVIAVLHGAGVVGAVVEAVLQHALGRPDIALALAVDPRIEALWSGQTILPWAVDVAWAVGLKERAEQLLKGILPFAGRLMSGGLSCPVVDGTIDERIGRLHALAGRYDEAGRWLRQALAQTRRVGMRSHFGVIERDLERVAGLRAGTLAWSGGTLINVDRPINIDPPAVGHDTPASPSPTMSTSTSTSTATPTATTTTAALSSGALSSSFTLERHGELWRVARGDAVFHLKDSRGLRLLKALIDAPGRELLALDLATAVDGLPGGAGGGGAVDAADAGDAGAVLDDATRKAYRARMKELDAELDDASGPAADRLRAEREWLESELSRAFGLGGRPRVQGSAVERARVAVTRRLKEAIARIAEHDAELGRHLAFAVRTGTRCRYAP